MEYILIAAIALIVFLILLAIIKIEKLRNKANALFLEAEKNINEEKLEYVCSNLYVYVPAIVKMFISIDGFEKIVQAIYNRTREIAKDILNDGKLNGR